jgi:hypothetical protein
MNANQYAERAAAIAMQVDVDRWSLAELARQGREAGIPLWDEIIGKLPRVRRAARTIRDWARAADVRQLCNQPHEVDFSCYVRASRYIDVLTIEQIEEVLETAERDNNSVDEVSAFLSELARPTREAREALLTIVTALRDALDRPIFAPVNDPLETALKAMDEAVQLFSEVNEHA